MQSHPINVAHLFDPLDQKLLELLSSLSAEEWHRPTIAKKWNVKDIAAHLLDGNIRVLSMSRDGYFGLNPGDKDLLAFLNEINADWVKAMKRMSPQTLLWMLEITGKPVSDHFASLDPFGKALFPVAWAGEEESFTWMHVAREYTEKFLHQQQIREAVYKPGILTKEFFFPFIDTFMKALPYTYRNVEAENGSVVEVNVTTDAGGNWYIIKDAAGWKSCSKNESNASIILDPGTAWKLFSKGIDAQEARTHVTFKGNMPLAEQVLNMVSVMA